MKTINTIRLLAALLAAVLLCSCTQNNGHIGKLFGTWVLTERLADGTAIEKPYDAEAYMITTSVPTGSSHAGAE